MGADARAGPGGVDRGDAAEGFGGGLQDEVVNRELDRIGAGFGETLVQRFAHRHERSGVDFDFEVEVGDRDLRLQESASDRLAHAAHGDVGVRLDALAVGGRSDCDVERAGRSGSGRSRSGGGDIAADDTATGAGAGEGGDIERGFLRHALRVRRGLGAGSVGLRRDGAGRSRRSGHAAHFGFLGNRRDGGLGSLRRRSGSGLRGGFALLADGADRRADGQLLAGGGVDLEDRTRDRAGKFHRRLVGFDFSQDVAEGHYLAFLDVPFHQSSHRHRVGELRHIDNFSHRI